MTEHILSAALTFALLAGGTVAIGSELMKPRHASAPVASATATLPTVMVIGKRQSPVAVAAETVATEPQRVE